MPISLKSASSGICTGVQLIGAQPVNFITTNTDAQYGTPISATNIDISSVLTQLCNVTVPAGKRLVILSASIDSLTATSSTIDIELEVDGTTVLVSATPTYSQTSARVVGSTTSVNSRMIKEIAVDSNFKIRAKKPGSSAVSITVSYILVSN